MAGSACLVTQELASSIEETHETQETQETQQLSDSREEKFFLPPQRSYGVRRGTHTVSVVKRKGKYPDTKTFTIHADEGVGIHELKDECEAVLRFELAAGRLQEKIIMKNEEDSGCTHRVTLQRLAPEGSGQRTKTFSVRVTEYSSLEIASPLKEHLTGVGFLSGEEEDGDD